ncbi:MAG: response regulator transcription factor [Bacteroidota bacterium]
MEKLKILIVDDHNLFRDSVAKFIKLYNKYEVAYHAENWSQAVELMKAQVKIDLMVVDLGLSKKGQSDTFSPVEGLELARFLHEQFYVPKMYEWKTILITGQRTDNLGLHIHRAFTYNINGFLLKGCQPEELIKAFDEVMNGRSYYRGEVNKLLSGYMNTRRELPKHEFQSLNPSELETLEMISDGFTSAKIAQVKKISEGGVENIRRKIKEKLGGNNLAHCVSIAYKLGILRIH